jgi:hypothetical protein
VYNGILPPGDIRSEDADKSVTAVTVPPESIIDPEVGGQHKLEMSLVRESSMCVKRFIIMVFLLVGHAATPPGGEAQTSLTPSTAPPSQNLSPQNLQGGQQVPSPGFSVPANVTTSQTTLGLNPAVGAPPSTTTSPRVTVGQGLPGMPGGPPLGRAGGAADPTTDYMTPPVVGPLFCDPAMNIPC